MADSRTINTRRGGIVGVCAVGAAIVANVVMYLLSAEYFSVCQPPANGVGACTWVLTVPEAHLTSLRVAFAVFTAVIGFAAIAAAVAPWLFAHGLAALAGICAVAATIAAATIGLPGSLTIVLAISAVMFVALTWHSMKGSRPAWAFLLSLSLVTALGGVFGAPKLRDTADINLWTAMIVPGLMLCCTIALAVCRDQFRNVSTDVGR